MRQRRQEIKFCGKAFQPLVGMGIKNNSRWLEEFISSDLMLNNALINFFTL